MNNYYLSDIKLSDALDIQLNTLLQCIFEVLNKHETSVETKSA